MCPSSAKSIRYLFGLYSTSPNKACTDWVLTVLPSSLDLLNSVVRECRPETAEIRRLVPPQAAASHSQKLGSIHGPKK